MRSTACFGIVWGMRNPSTNAARVKYSLRECKGVRFADGLEYPPVTADAVPPPF